MSPTPEAPYIRNSKGENLRVTPRMLIGTMCPSDGDYGLSDEAQEAALASLRDIRTPQAQLHPEFYPKETDTFDVPVMHYGIALSNEDVLKWAEVAHKEPSPRTSNQAEMERRWKDVSYNRRTRNRLPPHLQIWYDAPASVKWKPCFASIERPHVLSLYTNYDEPTNSALETNILYEFGRIDGWDTSRTFQWYWDSEVCGPLYCSPWRKYNLWPDQESRPTVRRIFVQGSRLNSWSYQKMKTAESQPIERGRPHSRKSSAAI